MTDSASAPSARDSRGPILIVDDEEVVRHLVARALTQANYEVLQAADGFEALAFLAGHAARLRLAIFDLVMPGLTGRDLAEVTAERWPQLPILFISGYPRAYLEEHSLLNSDLPLLKKPFLPSRLLEMVEETARADPITTP
jgi:two-component system cell cycle sensor histidine kinase/response regulator CckA